MDELANVFNDLERRWEILRNNQDDENFVAKELSELLTLTLQVNLDFRMTLNPELISNEQKIRIKDIMCSIKFNQSQKNTIEMLDNVDNWFTPFGLSLLSAKLIGLLSGKYVHMEKKFINEEDVVIETRINSLMQLFEISNSEDVTTMILNVFEAYRKLLVRDTGFQNKISCRTLEKLQKSYMVILCHRKQYDHLNSFIKTFPKYRKIQYVNSKHQQLEAPSKAIKTRTCESRLAAACIEELLKCEFEKGRLKQDIRFFHYYLHLLIDIAKFDEIIMSDLERIILSASDMNVISDYFYLAATLLRIKMPNIKVNLVLKLISIGLSHDISYLEEVKYSTANETIVTSQGDVSREQEFVAVHRRMYYALINLGFLIPHYPLARLCFHVASVCEPETNFCEKVLEKLPECDYNDYDKSTLDPVLLCIRYQLETFHYDIKGKTRLAATFKKVSSCSFESLEYFNHRVKLEDELKPLEYPGIEKYLKKQNIEDMEHVSQVSDLDKCIQEIETFNCQLSNGFKNLQRLFVQRKQETKYPTRKEVYDRIKEAINHAKGVYLTTRDEIFTDLESLKFEHIHKSNFKYCQQYYQKRLEENVDNLFFDWKHDDECGDGNNKEAVDLDSMYKSGVVKVLKLYRKGLCTLDIENVLLFAIMEKKMKFLSEEFAYLNKNRNVELDTGQHNQIHAGFLYIINRRHPEFCRLSRLTSSLKKYYHAVEYYLDSYIFDGTPTKYKFILKYKTYKVKSEISGVPENVGDQNSHEIQDIPLEVAKKVKEQPVKEAHTPKPKKFKNPSVILLTSNDKFNLSDEVRNIFIALQHEMSVFCGKDVKFNIQKLVDTSSPNMIHAVTFEKKSVRLMLEKVRNCNHDPRKFDRDVEFPLHATGKIQLTEEFRDEIEYDENFDNPRVKSSSVVKVSGNIVIEKLTHNVRFEIDCIVDSHVSKIKCGFQGSRSRPKKYLVGHSNSAVQPSVPQASQIVVKKENFVQQSLPTPPIIPPIAPIKNEDFSPVQQNAFLPPFDSIAPMPSHTIHPQPIMDFKQEPVVQFTNGNSSYDQTFIEKDHSFNIQTPAIPQQIESPKVKVEIQKIEIFTPPKHVVMKEAATNNIQRNLSFSSIPVVAPPPQNGHSKPKPVKDNGLVDFEDDLDNIVKPQMIPNVVPKYEISKSIQNNIKKAFHEENNADPSKETTPPKAYAVSVIQSPLKSLEVTQMKDPLLKSPPPLHHYTKGNSNSPPIVNLTEERTPTKAEQKFNNSSEDFSETIDLTDDNFEEIDLTKENNSIRREVFQKAIKTKTNEIAFVACAAVPMRNESDYTNGSHVHHKSFKRSASTHECDMKHVKVQLVDVMENLKQSPLKKNTAVRLIPVYLSPTKLNHYVAEVEPSEEQPIEEYAENLLDTHFTIVNFNSVSYSFHSLKGVGENAKKTNIASLINAKNTNVHREKLNNSDVSRIFRALDVDLSKTSYADKNRLNFSKNMKNYLKFNSRWSPKDINSDDDLGCEFDKENLKECKKKENNSLLYQMSHDLINSLPGMNSLEFFAFPSRAPRRALQIEVVHLKDLKTSTSSSSTSSSVETNDLNDGTNNEPVYSSSHNEVTAVTNGSISVGNSSLHVQKIGQTSISRENESKTFQTSFGTIIKNTYPPATSRDAKNIKKLDEKKVLITDGAKNNIKIIACTSQSSNEAPKAINKNQTLINMLTQQVMMPTNSNRHYIITSKPTEVGNKVEGNNIMMGSQGQQILRKNLATGQSQLVQILNSPPSNFTMKSLNVISTTATAIKPTNQVVTVTSSPSSTSTTTPELPNSVKQQGIVQFICKTDGKIIHLTPICNNAGGGGVNKKITYKVDTSGARGPTILHHANQQIILNNQLRKGENPNILTIIQKQAGTSENDKKKTLLGLPTSTAQMGTRSIYEENYAKFIQTPSGSSASDMGLLTISSSPSVSTSSGTFIQKIGKTVIQSSGQILPKFNQAFGKSIFSSSISSDQHIKKVVTNKEAITRSIVSAISPSVVSKITATKTEMTNIVDNESAVEKQSSLPTLQSALQGNNLLYARPIGNGKLIASGNNNNVLLTALRSNNSNQAATSNLRIITTMSDTQNVGSNRATIMTPVRISVPIQIPQLINSVRPHSPGNFRQQIVIATTSPNVKQTPITSSKLETLLLSPQNQVHSHLQSQNTTISIPKQEIGAISPKMKIEQQVQVVQKKNVDNSTLEQLREFDMVLEQVLERSSATPNSVSSPPRPDSASRSSPRKHCSDNKKFENKSSSVSVASISPNDSPSSSKSLSNSSKNLPKLQEDEHTAQRILDILANYKEQVRNSPDLNNKPAPRRRANPPTNPPASKRKKVVSSTGSIKNSKQFGSSSDVMTDTMGSEEDSSCGMGSGIASTGSNNNSPRGDIDEHTDVSMDNNFYGEDSKREIALSPQSSSSSVATSPAHNKFSMSRRLLMTTTAAIEPTKNSFVDTKSNVIISSPSSSASGITRSSSSSINESIERLSAAQGSTTAVLMPGNYILPMNVLKSGQQLAILSSNNGQKIIAVPANQLTSSHHASSGTSIILQRYVNQISEGGASLSDKSILTHSTNELESSDNQLKSFRLHASPNTAVSLIANSKIASGSSPSSNQATTDAFYAAVKAAVEGDGDSLEIKHETDSNASFVNDKTLITEIIQQQQQLARNHPQQNFMIKLNEPSDSSTIMFVSNNDQSDEKNVKIKSEQMDYEHVVIKEEAVDLHTESDILNSPMLNTKMEVDENTSSNHATDDNSQKMQQFQSILSSCLSKQPSGSKNTNKNFLIDPSNKTLMCNDRKTATIDKEIFNPKSFSEEYADLGVDEPIASDLFPEADLLFESGSPKFDQINPHHDSSQIKREIENGEVLLQMNYSHNITEPWLNFDTEDELVDDSSSDEVAATKSSIRANL